jgi:hypothetical protein
MILLMSSAGKETYTQFVLKVLSYPKNFELTDVPYSLNWVDDHFVRDPAGVENKQAVICLVDYVDRPGNAVSSVEALFLPMRLAMVERARVFAGKLLLRVRLGDFVYYSDTMRRGCHANDPVGSVLKWNSAIKKLPNAPHAIAKTSGGVINPGDRTSWGSGGRLVLQIADATLDFSIIGNEELIRARCDDWKSTIDVMAERSKLREKLFYQVLGLQRVSGQDLPLTTERQKSVYVVKSGESLDLMLHFYYGDTKRAVSRHSLEIVTPSEYISVVGSSTIEADPDQFSGKIESVRLRAKRQLAEEFAYITIRDKEASANALASTELYLRIRPAYWSVTTIIALFALGTLLSGIPTDMEAPSWLPSDLLKKLFTPWLLKVAGAALMTLAFWLGFSKLPSKPGQ